MDPLTTHKTLTAVGKKDTNYEGVCSLPFPVRPLSLKKNNNMTLF